MKSRAVADDLASVLSQILGGTAEVSIGGHPFAVLDGRSRDVTVHIRPLLGPDRPANALLQEGHIRLWALRGIPSALARSGWTVSIHDGPDELVRIGRDASALTGHVHLGRAGLGALIKGL